MRIESSGDEGLSSFLARLGSGDPTPGGGAVAALCGALAAALTAMVGALTTGKKKHADVAADFEAAGPRLQAMIRRFESLMAEDAVAFENWMAAARLPRGDEREKATRREAMERATRAACEPPMDVLRTCAELPPSIRFAADHGNPHAVSDAGIAGLLCAAAARAAAMNVRINLAGLAPSDRAALAAELDRLLAAATTDPEDVAREVEARLAAP